jgi:hypothetical protein
MSFPNFKSAVDLSAVWRIPQRTLQVAQRQVDCMQPL